MKKIFLAITAILIVGLFSGCASKPNNNAFARERFDANIPNLKNVEIIKKLIYKSTVSYEEYNDAYKLAFCANETKAKELRDQYSKKTNRKDFSGRIINKTDREAHIRIRPRYSYKAIGKNLPDMDITIPSHETIYFIIQNFFTLGQDKLSIIDLDDPSHEDTTGYSIASYNGNGEEKYLFFPVITEVLKTHSLEIIYDHYARPDDHNQDFHHTFIKPIEEKNLDAMKVIIIHQ